MSIPFTQFPPAHGRQKVISIELPKDVEALANEYISADGWFECEYLTNNQVSLTACWNMPDGDNDIAIRVVNNGPGVKEAVEDLVREAHGKKCAPIHAG